MNPEAKSNVGMGAPHTVWFRREAECFGEVQPQSGRFYPSSPVCRRWSDRRGLRWFSLTLQFCAGVSWWGGEKSSNVACGSESCKCDWGETLAQAPFSLRFLRSSPKIQSLELFFSRSPEENPGPAFPGVFSPSLLHSLPEFCPCVP